MQRALILAVSLALAACVATDVAEAPEKADSGRMVRQADGHFTRRAYDQALETYKLAALAADSNGEDENLVHALSGAAHVLIMQGRVSDSVPWLEGASPMATSEDPVSWSRFLLARGAYEQAVGEDAMAAATFAAMYAFCMATERFEDAIRAAHMATLVASDERVDWGMRGIAAAMKHGNARFIAAAWTSFAWLLEDEGRYEQSLKAFRSARDLHEEMRDEHALLVCDWSIAHSLRVAGRVAEARTQIEAVLLRAERRYARGRTRNDAEWLGQSLRECAEVALAQGHAAAALDRFVSARSRLIEAGIAQAAPENLRDLDERIAAATALAAGAKDPD